MTLKHIKSKLLVCVDDQPHSIVALHFACSKARHLNYALELIHVVDSSDYNNSALFGVADKIRDERREVAEKLMSEMAAEVQRYAAITPSCIIREGLVSEEVVKVVKEDTDFNMLIIGKAPQEAKKNDMISLLTSELASKLMIPMIIVPGNLSDKDIDDLI